MTATMQAASTQQAPARLRQLNQWIVWKNENGRKIPYTHDGRLAKINNPSDWCSYADATIAKIEGDYAGVGFVFAKEGGLVGIDLDDCLDENGEPQPWAQEIITDFGTYAEISPSGRGVKLWCEGKLPTGKTGKKAAYQSGAVEMYQHGRYFAFTGEAILATEICNAQLAIEKWWPKVFDSPGAQEKKGSSAEADVEDVSEELMAQYRAIIEEMPESIDGANGSDALFAAACKIRRWGLNREQSWELLIHYNNTRCSPPWDMDEIEHKWEGARAAEPLSDAEKLFEPIVGHVEIQRSTMSLKDCRLVPVGEFGENSENIDFLVEGVLTRGESFVIGGPTKVLKTAISLNLCYSLATGVDFLGHFRVPKPVKVAFFSAETHPRKMRHRYEVFRKKFGDDCGDNLWLSDRSPQLTDEVWLDNLRTDIRNMGFDVCLIDPAYKSVFTGGAAGADASSNVHVAGAILDAYRECGAETGCAMGLCHHIKKTSSRSSIDFNDLTGSGFTEWTRQSMMLGREGTYGNNGKHNIVMGIMGSQGFGGSYNVKVDEGVKNGITGHLWEVDVKPIDGEDEPVFVDENQLSNLEQQIVDEMRADAEAGRVTTCSSLKKATGRNHTRVAEALKTLDQDKKLIKGRPAEPGEAGGQRTTVYGLLPTEDEILEEMING